MIPEQVKSASFALLIITAEALVSDRNFLYFGFAKKEMHPEDAFCMVEIEWISVVGSPTNLPLTFEAKSCRLNECPDKLIFCLRRLLQPHPT